MDRRALLRGAGAATSAALAGCGAPRTDGGTTVDPDERFDGGGVHRDVVYRETPEATLALDLFVPDGADAAPVVVYCHGGGWRHGRKEGPFATYAERLASHGFAGAPVDYRTSDMATYPAAVRDVTAAVQWVRARADRYGLDPGAVGVAGGSAGGHLAALGGVAPDVESFRSREFDVSADRRVQAVAAFNGVFDLRPALERGAPQAVVRFLGGDPGEVPDRYREASPVVHVSGDDSPTFLAHGTEDRTVPYRQATRFRDALADAGVPVDLLTAEGAGHGFFHPNRRWYDEALERFRSFLKRRLADA